jgi:hypothetical protein
VGVVKEFSDTVPVQHRVDETNNMQSKQITKSVTPFTFSFRIRKQQDVRVDRMYIVYIVLALFMLMEILPKPTQRPYQSKNYLLFTSFFLKC